MPDIGSSEKGSEAFEGSQYFVQKDSELEKDETGVALHEKGESDKPVRSLDPNWKKDTSSLALLIFLYILQGVPLGIVGSIPLILASRKDANYGDQAKFSLAGWPFSLKLLWAPIVDAIFIRRMGRRKSWLVPIQYLLGAFLLGLSFTASDLLESNQIATLTFAFFSLVFLAATQDIATDGWALTMLSPENVGYASTCNSVGQATGVFLGFNVFIALESARFCNEWLRSSDASKDVGIVSMSDFFLIWACIFIVSTTLVWFFKREKDTEEENNEEHPGLCKTYKLLWKILNLRSIRFYALFLLTVQIGLAPADAITNLKLIEAGVPKEKLALINVPMTPLKIFLPFIISKYTAGRKPMTVYLNAMPLRLLFDLIFAALVYATPRYFIGEDGELGTFFWVLLVGLSLVHVFAGYCMFVAVMGFHARISDPIIGGTYMTLLNTVANLGSAWPKTLVLALVDPLTKKHCNLDPSNSCSTKEEVELCREFSTDYSNSTVTSAPASVSSLCTTDVDGYYILCGACFIIGLVYIFAWGRQTMKKLQRKPFLHWRA